jgi:hypothetical protein
MEFLIRATVENVKGEEKMRKFIEGSKKIFHF